MLHQMALDPDFPRRAAPTIVAVGQALGELGGSASGGLLSSLAQQKGARGALRMRAVRDAFERAAGAIEMRAAEGMS